MRKYRSDVSSTVRIEYGIELHAGLSQFAETSGAAVDVLAVNDALAEQQSVRIALRAPVLKARAALRFAEFNVDKVIRSAHRAAEIEDGARRGRVSLTLFPKGVSPVVKPSGKAQAKPMRELIDRLAHSKFSGMDGYRAVWMPKLEAAMSQLDDAIAAYEAANAAYDEAYKAEAALREAHLDLVDKVMGVVRTAFPRDRDVQDVIFPVPPNDVAKKEAAPVEPIERAPMSVGTA